MLSAMAANCDRQAPKVKEGREGSYLKEGEVSLERRQQLSHPPWTHLRGTKGLSVEARVTNMYHNYHLRKKFCTRNSHKLVKCVCRVKSANTVEIIPTKGGGGGRGKGDCQPPQGLTCGNEWQQPNISQTLAVLKSAN